MTSRRLIPLAAAALAAATCLAQTHKVTNADAVVRAIGVYEWTGDLTKPTGSRFVPITVFIDGQIEDAGVYLPRPVPFALLTGNVYELEDSGLGKGTLVLEQAMKTTTPEGAADRAYTEGWTAYGSYKPPPAERKSTATLRPSKTLPVIEASGGDSSKPHFSNKSAETSKPSSGTQSGSTQQPASGNTTKPDTASTSDTAQSTDDSRPTMRRRTGPPPPSVDDETSPPQDPNAAASQKPSDDDRAERPTLQRRTPDEIAKDQKDKKKAKESASVTASGGSMNDDPDRPKLKHGSASREDDEMPKLMGVPTDMKQMVAVSDAKNRAAHPFARPWEDPSERAAILTKMQTFARAKLADYGVVPGSDPVTRATAAPAAAAASTAAKTTAPGATTSPAPSNEGPAPPKLKRGIPTDDTTIGTSPAPASAAKPTPKPATADSSPPTLKRGAPSSTATTTAAASASTRSTTTAPKTATAHTTAKGKRTILKGPPQVELAGEELKGYLLSYGGAPTYVYTAHTVEANAVTRYVTVVAQADGMGQLKVAISSATDAAHLDRTPWMRLVDAVDVEASNRASLLFELRGQSSRQFALYRVIAAKPEQIFTTSM